MYVFKYIKYLLRIHGLHCMSVPICITVRRVILSNNLEFKPGLEVLIISWFILCYVENIKLPLVTSRARHRYILTHIYVLTVFLK